MQKYFDFEVLIMDDHSTDSSKEYVESLQKEIDHLTYYQASEEIKDKEGKKWALAEAIAKAKNETLLFTDADCKPSSLSWIELMTSSMGGKTQIVLGIGQYENKSRWFDHLVQYETMFTAISYLGFALSGKAYMGVGRNLAYMKSIFDLDKNLNLDLASGDDDLFIQNVANHENTAICIDGQGQTISKSPESYSSWIKQKQRHHSTAFSYKFSVKLKLMLFKASNYIPNYLMILLFIKQFHPSLIAYIFVLRYLFSISLFSAVKRQLGFSQTIYLLPCYEIYFSLLDTWLAIKNLMKIRTKWK